MKDILFKSKNYAPAAFWKDAMMAREVRKGHDQGVKDTKNVNQKLPTIEQPTKVLDDNIIIQTQELQNIRQELKKALLTSSAGI